MNALHVIHRMPVARDLVDWMGRFWSVRCLGGTPDAIMLAAGEFDVWIEPKVAPWDLAATQIVLEEAGAVFFDFTGKRTIYGGRAVACTPALEGELRTFLGIA